MFLSRSYYFTRVLEKKVQISKCMHVMCMSHGIFSEFVAKRSEFGGIIYFVEFKMFTAPGVETPLH